MSISNIYVGKKIVAVYEGGRWIVLLPRLNECYELPGWLNPEGLDELSYRAIKTIMMYYADWCDYRIWADRVRGYVISGGGRVVSR